MGSLKEALEGPDGQKAIAEYFAAHRNALTEGASEDAADIADFLGDRGIEIDGGSLTACVVSSGRGVVPMRPVPDCPGGYCVPEPCPDGSPACGWVCHCP